MDQLRKPKGSAKLDHGLVKIKHSGQERHGSDWDQSFQPIDVAAIQPAESKSDPHETLVRSTIMMVWYDQTKNRHVHGAPHPPSNHQSLAFLELGDVKNRPKAFGGQSGACT